MRHVDGTHIRPIPATRTPVIRSALLFLAILLASCGSGSDTPVSTAPVLGNDATLSSLAISGATLDPAFNASVTDYAVSVSNSTDNVDVSATPSDGRATWTVNGGSDTSVPLQVGDNTISILVTAEDGTTTRTYTVVVARAASDNADLVGLELTNVVLVPRFDAKQTAYTASVDFLTVTTQITATPEDTNATIRLNGTAVPSGVVSDPLALAVGSNTITVAVTAEDNTTSQIYNVVVSRQSASALAQAAYVKASNTDADDAFAWSVALSSDGETLAVGAPAEDSAATGIDGDQTDNNSSGSGAVYVFAQDSAGVWAQQAYMKASNSYRLIVFGHDIALSQNGSTLAVSAIFEGHARSGDLVESDFPTGAVYIFSRDNADIWIQQAVIRSPYVVNPGDQFGSEIALSGDGATLAACVGRLNWWNVPMSVEVFTRDNGGAWNEQAYIEGNFDCFRASFALSDDGATLAVGTYGSDSGAVYVFARDSTGDWRERAYIQSSNAEAFDEFGRSVSLSADGATLAVGAVGEDSAAIGVNGDQADNNASGSGAVYVFAQENAGQWTQQAYVKASNSGEFDNFGCSVSLSADGATLAVGAVGEDSAAIGVNGDPADNSGSDSGAVYVFARDSAGVWAQEAYLKSSNADLEDRFGLHNSLSADGTALAVSARHEDSAATGVNGNQADNGSKDSGAVYVFER